MANVSLVSTPSTVTLHNRFQCLRDLCASTDDMIHNDIHTITSVEKHRDNSVHASAAGNKINHVKQHLEECKPPQSCYNDMLPMLANQENNALKGNKNKTGLLDVVSHSLEEQKDVAALTPKKLKVGACLPLDTVCCERQQGHTHVSSDTQNRPQLAYTKNYSLEGNKNKIGSFDRNDWDVSKRNKLDNCSQSYMAAGVDNQVSTENLNMALDGNCYRNNI